MAAYTRQSTFTDGDTIFASLLNNEYDQLAAAFNVSSGHTHDGSTTGDGGPISKLFSNAITFGTNVNADVVVTFDATSNDGVLSWMEDEDYFEFSDDILVDSAEKVLFRDSAIYIHSSTDGQLDLVADTEIQIAATTVDLNGNLDVSGTLKIGSGATVSTILDEDNFATDSATALATQQSIKAYVDAVTTSLNAQDLDFQGDSGGALNIDLDTEVLDIAGGTNITTAGSGNTLTVNLDTALTGLTSAVIDNVTIADNSITTNASNANLQLGANGSGKIELMSNTISRTGDIIFDASADIILDAGGKDIIFRYDGAQFGLFTFAGGNLLIQSGSTTMLTGDGANAIFNGNITVPGSSTLDGVTITDNTIKSNASNADLQIGTAGTGVIDILTATQSTVGSAGGASALPGQPTGYIKVKIGGTMRVIPFYDES